MKRPTFWIALFRLPVLIAVVYLYRHSILDLIEWYDGLGDVTATAIDLLSTPASRLTYSVVVLVVVLAVWRTARRWSIASYVLPVVATILLAAASIIWLGAAIPAAVVGVLAVATNLAAASIAPGGVRNSATWRRVMAFGVGVGELFFSRAYLEWIIDRVPESGGGAHRIATSVPGLMFATAVLATALDGGTLTPVEQWLRSSHQVRTVSRGDINWIELDPTGRYLFVTGHGLDRMRRYDVSAAPPLFLESAVSTGSAQSFGYNPMTSEIYIFEHRAKRLLYLDSESLTLKQSVAIPEIAVGDMWIAADDASNTILISSEQDYPGTPVVVVDRSTGAMVDQLELASGNLLKHPSLPYVYLSSFRGVSHLSLYDMSQREVRRRTHAARRSHRMAYWRATNEVLLAASTEARIQRFDAETLVSKGSFAVPFGVRTIAIDEARQLMLCASTTSGVISLLDLSTGKMIAKYYLGPWLRSIALLPSRGMAWVSSKGALYQLQYDATTSGR